MTTWVDGGQLGQLREIAREDRHTICLVLVQRATDGGEPRPWPEGEANFDLVLAAPQMLEALEAIRDKVECYLQPLADCQSVSRARLEAVREQAVTAIAAVKGENGDDIG